GMGWLSAYLPGDDLMAINKHLDTLATSTNDGIRTMDQRRADTLRDLLLGTTATITTTTCANAPRTGATDGTPRPHAADGRSTADISGPADAATGRSGCADAAAAVGQTAPAAAATHTDCAVGVAATIYVTVSAETLLGLDQRAGELRGYGPITADHARELAYSLKSKWLGVLVDHNGRAVTMTSNAYPFRGRLAEFIRLRDTTCTHPGCDRPADRCDIDHIIPWPRGQTTPDNASTECRRHHRMKTLTNWEVSRKDDQIEWRKPNGTTLTKPVEPIAATSPQRNSSKPPNDDPPPF
ncbi:MAG: HNH endonuclease, partial [Mycobacterium sp.]|nr:HNH endonuclease [Mycobacterium sp.]